MDISDLRPLMKANNLTAISLAISDSHAKTTVYLHHVHAGVRCCEAEDGKDFEGAFSKAMALVEKTRDVPDFKERRRAELLEQLQELDNR